VTLATFCAGGTREPSGPDSRCSSSPSPSSSPGLQQQSRAQQQQQQQQHQHQQQQQQQQQPTRAASSSSSGRSGDSDDQAPLQPVKSEAPEERPRDKSSVSGGGRRLAGILATHTRLRRLLGTLVHFAMDISTDTGEAVRALVIGLLVRSRGPLAPLYYP
jgi:hypothetical protein